MLLPLVYQVINLLNYVSVVHVQSTCGPKVSPRLLMEIPCDMAKTGWCDLSGSAYPWSAVRRYIYENQGLLKRMYGDQRHYSILTNEIHELKEKYDNIYMHEDAIRVAGKKKPQFKPRSIYMEEIRELSDENNNNSNNEEMDFETFSNDHSSTLDEGENDFKNSPSSQDDNIAHLGKPLTTTIKPIDNLLTSTIGQTNTEQSSSEQTFATLEESTTTTTTTTTTATTTTRPFNQFLTSPSNSSHQMSTDSSASSERSTLSLVEHFSSSSSTSSPASPAMPKETTEASASSFAATSSSSSSSSSEAYSDASSSTLSSKSSEPAQSTASPINRETPKKGINACPVREEVIAPYWANNTRGEVLALLNVYPFEQYVHWEKCAYEDKQMFCRSGCKCEQQYRLHRLLAFDPKNDCRGIFADWFRFPSCCVCICYDLPESSLYHYTGSTLARRKGRL